MRGGNLLNTPKRRENNYEQSSSDATKIHHMQRISEKGFTLEEYKKKKSPTFDGENNKAKEAEAWLLGMKKYFKVHDYYENMKAKVAILA